MEQLDLGHEELAESVYRIAIANMAEAIRSVTVRRGYDPRDYALFACGGAGPMVAAALAEELDAGSVLVPPDPGVFSAFGLTAAGLRMDFARAVERGSPALESAEAFAALMDGLREDARRAFGDLGIGDTALSLAFTADARYAGQGFELRVPFDGGEAEKSGPAFVAAAFHEVHAQRYGHAFEEQTVEITALRLTASCPAPSVLSAWHTLPSGQDAGTRTVSVGGTPLDAALLDRAALPEGGSASGPALCTEPTTTTFVPDGWSARIDGFGLLHLERRNP